MKKCIPTIMFPCLAMAGDRLFCCSKSEFLRFVVKRRLRDGLLLCRGAGPKGLLVSCVIDRSGGCYIFQVVRRRGEWLRSLRWLWDFVLAECKIIAEGRLTCEELLARLQPLNASPPFQRAGHLRAFLRRQKAGKVFDGQLYREFWEDHCPPVRHEQWTEEYP